MENSAAPDWFVYDGNGELDVPATLQAAPEIPDETLAFFRGVPEWFEPRIEGLDEMRRILADLDRFPEEEKKRLPEEAVAVLKETLRKMIDCYEMAADPNLSGTRRKVLRAICYWISLAAMEAVPLTSEEAEMIF